MDKTKILVHKKYKRSRIDPRIYGSFVEHMGRVVYSGIYEPGHPSSDEDGFRQDVMEAVRKMGVTAVRYPGGNFVSNYDWRDGVGPKEMRPRRIDLAWKSVETNEVGTDEFMRWARKADVEPVFAVNLGTKGIESAVSLLEYCNFPGGTLYSDKRRENGAAEPYGIRTWCLGNEMDGKWQIGHKTAYEYGRLAAETGRAMKLLDSSIELAVCGSSLSTNATFGDWERTVMEETYDVADYISLHQYYGGQEKGTAAFLSQALDMERYIRTVCGICDAEAVKRRQKKKVDICFDEWGIWEQKTEEVTAAVERSPWQVAPAFSEQVYTMEDALLFASMLMGFLRESGRVRIACQSLLTNVSACIMTEKSGGVWLQTLFYPFSCMAEHGRGVVMETCAEGPSYAAGEFDEVPYIDHVAVYDPDRKELVLFLVNRGDEAAEVEFEFQMFETGKILESSMLHHRNKDATNQKNHAEVVLRPADNFEKKEGRLTGKMEALSFQMIRVEAG